MIAPIALFAFNRPEHLRRTLEALASNTLAGESDLTIFCDGPRREEEEAQTEAVRAEARAASGFHSCTVIELKKNRGLAASILTGVTHILENSDRIIVLEDDMVTSPYFLQYMNDGLNVYAENLKVASIHGWCFPNTINNPPETFFLHGADCWGWATWKRAWSFFEPDAGKLLMQLYQRNVTDAFNLDGAYNYTEMLQATLEGKIDSWAVRWHASAFLHNMYTLHPSRSLVQNIGLDASGTHCGNDTTHTVLLSTTPVKVTNQPVKENATLLNAKRKFYHSISSTKNTLRSKWIPLLKDCIPPLLLRHVKQLRQAGKITEPLTWQGNYPDWQGAVAASTGYDQKAIFVKVRDAARAVRDGKARWERDSTLFYHEEYNLPLLSVLMSVAAWNKGRLRVLDFGGAFGSTYWQHKHLLQKLDRLSWNVVEQPQIVACGQEEFSTDELRFWPDIQTCAAAAPVDVVLLSSVLQYLEHPYDLLEQTVALHPQAIILARTPFAEQGERITVQHVPAEIYAANYPCRWLNRSRVTTILRKNYCLLPDYRTHFDPPGFCGLIAIKREQHAE